MATTVTICDTCKWPDGEKVRDGQTAGEAFAALVEAAAEGGDVTLRRHSCLMGCDHPCNAAVQADGKVGYVLGRFEPTAEAAEALLGYAEGHAASASGVVPFKTWPQGVKGKFIARLPAL